MGLQILSARAVRRIEKALNPPGKWMMCFHREPKHVWPLRMTVARGVANGGYSYFFTVANPAHPGRHQHGWMDLKLWRKHVQWPWGDLPGLVQDDCEFRMGMPGWWERKGVWGWDDDPVCWSSCRELFPPDGLARVLAYEGSPKSS